jgi:hypothetical protein
MMDTVPNVSFENEQRFLQMSKSYIKERDTYDLKSETEDRNHKNANYVLENLFYIWIPTIPEPLIVCYSEHFQIFKGHYLRIITLRDLTADFKMTEQS